MVLLPLKKNFKHSSIAESCSPHSKVLHEAKIFHLMTNHALIKECYRETTIINLQYPVRALTWSLAAVGLDAANIRWLLRQENSHQFTETGLKLCSSLWHKNGVKMKSVNSLTVGGLFWEASSEGGNISTRMPSLLALMAYIERQKREIGNNLLLSSLL